MTARITLTRIIRPSELHVGDVINWTPYVNFPIERHVHARVQRVEDHRALVDDSRLHPGCWIADTDAERLAIEFEYMTLPTAVAMTRVEDT